MSDSRRQHPRFPATLAVSYRTTGAFLIAYSVNLSKGGIFIEAPPLPMGTRVQLTIEIPGAQVPVEAVVNWVRTQPEPGRPVGMGLEFARSLDEELGIYIDALASAFEGVEVLVLATMERRPLLVRYVQSVIDCDCIETDSTSTAAVVIGEGVDLVMVDMDTTGAGGMEVILRALAAAPAPPVIALAADDEAREWARKRGVDQVLSAPPAFSDLQTAMIQALSRPVVR
jgi:uncharacterized protein (TIGR02266 family)